MHINSTLPKKILAWYYNSKRKLPWRVGKKSPKKLYYRLLSEFMLQQTQVKTVIPYFNKFTKKFKTIKALSKSNEREILKMWEGLGYYRRARNLLACSKILVNNWPDRPTKGRPCSSSLAPGPSPIIIKLHGTGPVPTTTWVRVSAKAQP